MPTRIHKKIVAALGSLLVIFLMVAAAFVLGREPSLDSRWDEDVRVLSGVELLAGGTVQLNQVRDWRYTQEEIVSKNYFTGVYDPSDIIDLWLYEQELGLGGLIAHTFLVFEFPESYGDARWLGLSVETRRELGEEYSLVGGMLRAFELTHIWANEKDLVTRRVQFLDYPLTRYRVNVPSESLTLGQIFLQFANQTADLAINPRWYNTLTTNCTSSLISYVNEVSPGAIPLHPSFVFTGRADDYLAGLGYLDSDSEQSITRDWLVINEVR